MLENEAVINGWIDTAQQLGQIERLRKIHIYREYTLKIGKEKRKQ